MNREIRNDWFMYMTGMVFDNGTGENQRPLTKTENEELEIRLSEYFNRSTKCYYKFMWSRSENGEGQEITLEKLFTLIGDFGEDTGKIDFYREMYKMNSDFILGCKVSYGLNWLWIEKVKSILLDSEVEEFDLDYLIRCLNMYEYGDEELYDKQYNLLLKLKEKRK